MARVFGGLASTSWTIALTGEGLAVIALMLAVVETLRAALEGK